MEKNNKGRKRKLFLKILLGFFIFIFLLVAFLPLYSGWFVHGVTDNVGQALGRQVSMKSFSLNLLTSRVYMEDLVVKEENGVDNFVSLAKVDLDFSIFAAISGNIEIPKLEISGLNVYVKKDENGVANYQSLIKQTSADNAHHEKKGDGFETSPVRPETEKEPSGPVSPTPTSPATKPLQLPNVWGDILISDINFYYDDLQQKTQFHLTGFGVDCNIRGLDNIKYQSKNTQIKFSQTDTNVQLENFFEGQVALKIKENQPFLTLQGGVEFSKIQGKIANKVLPERFLKIFHNLELDASTGNITSDKLGLESSYGHCIISQLQLAKLNEISKLSLPEKPTPEQLEGFLQKLPTKDWQLKIDAQVDFDKIYEDLGEKIAQSTQGEKQYSVEKFGGKITFSNTISGQPQAGFDIKENLQVTELFAAGRSPENKPYKALISKIDQNFAGMLDFQNIKYSTTSNMVVESRDASGNKLELLTFKNESAGQDFLRQTKMKLQKLHHSLRIDLTAIAKAFQDFFPQDTTIAGHVSNSDDLSGSVDEGFQQVGSTDIVVKVDSPKAKKLPELRIKGERDIQIQVTPDSKPKLLKINKLYLDSQGNEIIRFRVSGSANLEKMDSANIKMIVASKFSDLVPYLDVFVKGIQLQGILKHTTEITGNQNVLKIQGGGSLSGFAVKLPTEEKTQQFSLSGAEWKNDIDITLQAASDGTKKPDKIVFTNLYMKVPGAYAKLSGSILQLATTPPNLVFDKVTAQTEVKFPDILPLLAEPLAQSGMKFHEKSKGTMQNSVLITGDFNTLQIKNVLRHSGKLLLLIKEPRKDKEGNVIADAEPIIKKLLVDESLKSDVVLQIMGIAQNTEQQKAPIDIVIQPSYFQVLLGNSSVTKFDISGKATQTEQQLDIPGIQIVGKVHGKSLHQSLPIDFIAAEDNDKKQMLQSINMDGHIDVLVDIKGSTKDKVYINIDNKLDPLSFKIAHKKLYVVKDAKAPLFCKAKIVCDVAGMQSIEKAQETEEKDPEALKILEYIPRQQLKNVVVDVDFQAKNIQVDKNNSLKSMQLSAKMNTEKKDNKFIFATNGNVNSGTFLVESNLDLDDANPDLQTRYDINELPFVAGLFEGPASSLEEYISVPILDKFQFSDTASLTFNLKGDVQGKGIDWRALKKSLLSNEMIEFTLPKGEFNLGLNIAEFIDIKAAKEQLEKAIAPLQENVNKVLATQKGLEGQTQETKKQMETLDNTIQTAEGKKNESLKIIQQLEKIPFAGGKLKEAKSLLQGQQKEIDNLKAQKQKLADSLKPIFEKVDVLQKQVVQLQQQMEEKRKELNKKLSAQNPFRFDFNNCKISLQLKNDDPWKGIDGLLGLKKHPVSRINYIGISFTAAGSKPFPVISGWSDLDGNYNFKFVPDTGLMNDLQKSSPILYHLINKNGGISWNSAGFDIKK